MEKFSHPISPSRIIVGGRLILPNSDGTFNVPDNTLLKDVSVPTDNILRRVNKQTGTTYTLNLETDNGAIVECENTSAITLTLPKAAPVGWECKVVRTGGGSGTVTYAAESGGSVVGLASVGNQYIGNVVYVRANSDGASAVWVARIG